MKEKPDELTSLLREWQPESPPLADVRREVWKRIERLDPSPWKKWMDFFETLVRQPAVATGIITVAVTAGVMLGTMASASAQTDSYLQSLSAFHQPR